jgi:hypothetical protein
MAAGCGGDGDRRNPAAVHSMGNRNDARRLSESGRKLGGRVQIAGYGAVNFGRIDGKSSTRRDAATSRSGVDSYYRNKRGA